MKKIKVGAVSYLNTKPLIWGFEQGLMKDEIELIADFPANIAEALINDEVDVALVPVAVIPQLKEYYIISDYCIGAVGEVASVCLFSDVPLEEIENIYLDYQSKSSVALLKVLLKNLNIYPNYLSADENYIDRISGTTAGVIIGDRALKVRSKYKYVYDLAEEWIKMTGLPFVFAAWVSNKKLPEDFINKFNEANALGFKELDKVLDANPFEYYDLKKYYLENISYVLNTEKRKGLELFLNLIET